VGSVYELRPRRGRRRSRQSPFSRVDASSAVVESSGDHNQIYPPAANERTCKSEPSRSWSPVRGSRGATRGTATMSSFASRNGREIGAHFVVGGGTSLPVERAMSVAPSLAGRRGPAHDVHSAGLSRVRAPLPPAGGRRGRVLDAGRPPPWSAQFRCWIRVCAARARGVRSSCEIQARMVRSESIGL
jgi:hypothetical protein